MLQFHDCLTCAAKLIRFFLKLKLPVFYSLYMGGSKSGALSIFIGNQIGFDNLFSWGGGRGQ